MVKDKELVVKVLNHTHTCMYNYVLTVQQILYLETKCPILNTTSLNIIKQENWWYRI